MDGLARMMREYAEHRDGRIGWWHCLYLFLDTAGRRKRKNDWKGGPWPERIDSTTGKPFALFHGRGAQCFHPEKWRGIFPYWSNEGRRAFFIVTAKDCKGCEFHEPAKHYGRRRYASCRWFRENNGLDHPATILAQSVKQAEEMVKF